MALDVRIVAALWQGLAEEGERVAGSWIVRNVGNEEGMATVKLYPPAGIVFDEGPAVLWLLPGEEVQQPMSFTMPGYGVQFVAQAQSYISPEWVNTGNPKRVDIALVAAPTPVADIIAVNFPATAMEGEYVTGTIEVRNTGPVAGFLAVGAQGPGVTFDIPPWQWVQPGATTFFLLGFTMGSLPMLAGAHGYHDENGTLVEDDVAALDVDLTAQTGRASDLEISYLRVV